METNYSEDQIAEIIHQANLQGKIVQRINGQVIVKDRQITEQDIERARQALYVAKADPLLNQVLRGSEQPITYVSLIAKIKFENKYPQEKDRTYNSFYNEVAVKWNTANPTRKVDIKG